MRFTLIKDLREDNTMKPVLGGLLFFILLYLIFDIFVKESSMGLTFTTLMNTLVGNEEEFIDPMSKSSFLEYIHMEVFFSMMILLTLSSAFIRLSSKGRHTLLVLNIVMICALFSLLALVLSYFISSDFIYPYIVSFLSWHILGVYMSLYSLFRLYSCN
ncbi:hypothetical protein GJV85_07075 [Sulfurimonas aquatica]|uniref:Uncharacterized protein n=1 Tax=Sulfurimonas aquatica TaxID=2672570 RepID=A0A975B0F9_9BACT|nr:hypothetical protein [Sulfurimonas aquatica]QSZ41878.1 hypothetical protein GJV85_07075 [Sulfurimonas aquatica]